MLQWHTPMQWLLDFSCLWVDPCLCEHVALCCGLPRVSGAFVRVSLPQRCICTGCPAKAAFHSKNGCVPLVFAGAYFQESPGPEALVCGLPSTSGWQRFPAQSCEKNGCSFFARSCWQSKNDFSHAVSCFLPSYVTRY